MSSNLLRSVAFGTDFGRMQSHLLRAANYIDELEAQLAVAAKSPQELADGLDYMQRKALRRLGRGQSLSTGQQLDSLTKAFYNQDGINDLGRSVLACLHVEEDK